MAKKKTDPLYYTIPMEEAFRFHRKLQSLIAESKAKGLITYLTERFLQESLEELFKRYRLGLCDKRNVIYPYIDVENRLRSLKRMKYGDDGKRCRNGKKSIGVGYLHLNFTGS